MEVPRDLVLEALNDKNYTSWAACIKNYLMGKGLWEIVDGSVPEPNPGNSSPDSIKKWRKQNAKALHAIQVSCSSRMLSYIIKKTSAKCAWNCLASIHAWNQHRIDVPTYQPTAPTGSSENRKIPYMDLYNAVITGDRVKTKDLLKDQPEAARAELSTDGGTALHNAVLHEQEHLVEHLVNLMDNDDLKRQRQDGATALHIAATGSKMKIAEALVNKNEELLCLPNSDGYIPVCIAALYGHDKGMLQYLYSVTPEKVIDPKDGYSAGATLLCILVMVEVYDIALNLLERFPELAIKKDENGKICLNVLAKKVSLFPTKSQLSTWQRSIYNHTNVELNNKINPTERRGDIENPSEETEHSSRGGLVTRFVYQCFNETYQLRLKQLQAEEILKRTCNQLNSKSPQDLESLVMPAMLEATEAGNIGFIKKVFDSYPALKQAGSKLGGIFHIAVAQRQESIWYTFRDDLRSHGACIKDEFKNNILHMAAMLGPDSYLHTLRGPAMQMQRELRWFKEVQKVVPAALREQQNSEGKTPETLFSEQHNHLIIEGRNWLKETATSCMVVAALIATVMFEGANNTENWNDKIEFYWYSFHIYMIADALSLLSSTVSVLAFLSIFTSRYAHEDFLDYLPNRLAFGLFTLFFSIGTMMLAFGVLFFANLNQSAWWRALGFSSVAMVPVVLFASLHFPLLVEMIRYAYGPSVSIRNPKTRGIFSQSYKSH